MFTQTWNKYLPIIKILMKRSVTGSQSFDMNQTDFQRAAGGRKIKFTFTISLHKGRIQNITNPPALAKDLSELLQENSDTNKLVRKYDYEFSLNSNFQLTIKNSTSPLVESESTEGENNRDDSAPTEG